MHSHQRGTGRVRRAEAQGHVLGPVGQPVEVTASASTAKRSAAQRDAYTSAYGGPKGVGHRGRLIRPALGISTALTAGRRYEQDDMRFHSLNRFLLGSCPKP